MKIFLCLAVLIMGCSANPIKEYSPNDKNFQLGQANFEAKQYKEANDFFTLSIYEHPKNIPGYVQRARTKIFLKDESFCLDYKKAIELIEEYGIENKIFKSLYQQVLKEHGSACK